MSSATQNVTDLEKLISLKIACGSHSDKGTDVSTKTEHCATRMTVVFFLITGSGGQQSVRVLRLRIQIY
jgi:hypothetical protein